MIDKILNNTTPYGKIRASHEGSLHSPTLIKDNGDPQLGSVVPRCALSGAVWSYSVRKLCT